MFSLERDHDTICAVATAPGVGGIAVIRLSGSIADQVIRKSCPFIPNPTESHRVYYGFLIDPISSEEVDEVLVTYFQKGKSFTNEETYEISCHGGQVVSQNILDILIQSGARLAEPGEFTYRAFMSGRIDLVQAESVLQLIDSQSKKSARLSLRQLKGQLSNQLRVIETEMTEILAHLEANIDFAAEDIEIKSNLYLSEKASAIETQLAELLKTYQQGRIINSGLKVALIGLPNVGKSSLMNTLVGEERAIVTDVPGTTRDIVESRTLINGVVVEFVDTAGLRSTEDKVEKLGIQRTQVALREADLVFVVVDLACPALPELQYFDGLDDQQFILVGNKLDLLPGGKGPRHS
ncbi:MAG: tRNA uridine-5-carboxymethylaminomethyl(34) synthesis GTPase MnmE [Bdellovibrionales bacterium]